MLDVGFILPFILMVSLCFIQTTMQVLLCTAASGKLDAFHLPPHPATIGRPRKLGTSRISCAKFASFASCACLEKVCGTQEMQG